MGYSLGQAAKAAGRSKTTIHRAITSGRLSASRTDAGGYSIDPSELARVFRVERAGNGTVERRATGDGTDPVAVERDLFRALAEERLEVIRDLRTGLDDLRTRLDDSEAERRQLSERMAGLLTARSEALSPLPAGEPQRVAASPAPIDAAPHLAAASGGFATVPLVADFRAPWWRRWFR